MAHFREAPDQMFHEYLYFIFKLSPYVHTLRHNKLINYIIIIFSLFVYSYFNTLLIKMEEIKNILMFIKKIGVIYITIIELK